MNLGDVEAYRVALDTFANRVKCALRCLLYRRHSVGIWRIRSDRSGTVDGKYLGLARRPRLWIHQGDTEPAPHGDSGDGGRPAGPLLAGAAFWQERMAPSGPGPISIIRKRCSNGRDITIVTEQC